MTMRRAIAAANVGLPLLLLSLALLLVGCASDAPTAAAGPGDVQLVDELIAEASRVAGLVSAPRLLLLLGLFALGLLSTRAFDAVVRLVWRLGLDPEHKLGVARRLADVLVFGALGSWVATRLLAAAPILTGLCAIVGVAGALWALARPVEDLVAGLGIVLRGRIHEGDHVRLGEHHGTVTEIGLMRLVLRDPEGATVYVPHRLLDQAVVQVHRDRRQVPVQVHVPCDRAVAIESMETARRVALLSPWRIPGTPVMVELDPDEAGLRVELQTFTELGARPAAQQVRLAATAALLDREARSRAAKGEAAP